MSEHERDQVAATVTEIYAQFFIPALFVDWPVQVRAAAGVGSGHRVLDVACGTRILARQAPRLVGESGAVTGPDIHEGLLSVARPISDKVYWETGATARHSPGMS